MTADGTPERPIAIVAAGDGEVVFDGNGNYALLMAWRGEVWAELAAADGQVFPPRMLSYVAVKLYGPGHVVAYNYIANFHDGINIETYGSPDGAVASGPGIVDGPHYPPQDYWDRRPVAIDFYNNLITNSHDNPIEADGGMHNIRILRNMLINHPSHAFCNQPVLGGPAYWIRNIAYNLPGGSTRITAGSAGVVLYNNTILAETAVAGGSNLHWRNNLMLGQNAAPEIFTVATYTPCSSSDYNGFAPNEDAATAFAWALPAAGDAAFPGPDGGVELERRAFATLEAYSRATGQDRNSVLVDYGILRDVPRLDASDTATLLRIYEADDFDFRLRPGSVAVDRGVAIANVTDDFAGDAPDLGALEQGADPPHYGPRF